MTYIESHDALMDAAKDGGVIQLGECDFVIEEPIVCTSTTRIVGQGALSVLRQVPPDRQVIVFDAPDNYAAHFTIKGEGKPSGVAGLGAIRVGPGGSATGAPRTVVESVSIDGVGICGVVVSSRSDCCSVRHCSIAGCGEESCYALGSRVVVEGNRLEGPAESGVKCRAADAVIRGNIIGDCGQYGILLAPDCVRARVEGNDITSTGFECVLVNEAREAFLLNNRARLGAQWDAKRQNYAVRGDRMTFGLVARGNLSDGKAVDV